MRQVFRKYPWVHGPAPEVVQHFFQDHGRYKRLPQGASIFNGGDQGEIALVLTGVGSFSFSDYEAKNHIFTLIFPGSLMGDVDGLTGESVNVIDSAFRAIEVRMLRKEMFVAFLNDNPEIAKVHGINVIGDHESDMEGMVANFTLPLEKRIPALLQSIVWRIGNTQGDFFCIPLSVKSSEISQIVSASRQSVNSLISHWEKRGLILRSKNDTCIHKDLFAECRDWTEEGAVAGKIRKSRKKKASKAAE